VENIHELPKTQNVAHMHKEKYQSGISLGGSPHDEWPGNGGSSFILHTTNWSALSHSINNL